MHDAQIRLGDLEAELHKLKPLLVIQPTLPPHLQRQEPTQSPMPYPYNRLQSYMSPKIQAPPFTSSAPRVAISPYSASSSHDANQKRKRDGTTSSKGKEKEATVEDVSDANADDDSDNTDAPLTPTPASSASHNPYAYMNNLYRHVFSPSNTVLPATPLKPPGIQSNGSFGTNSNSPSAVSLNHYTVAYSAYPFTTATVSKQPPNSAVVGSWSNVGRPDDADKDGIQVDEIHNTRQEKGKSTSAASRRTIATSGRQQVKYKTSSMLNDARAEHLLLAARKIGRGRAVTIAGLVKAQERSATEESGKDKAKPKDMNRHSEASHASRSTQRRRVAGINSPTTPTPRRVHGHTQPLTEVTSLAVTPNDSRTRETLFSSGKTPRNRSSVADVNASGINASKDDEGLAGIGQTPLDSLLSAARTMMSEDRESGPTVAGQSVTSNVGAAANQDVTEHHLSAEESQGEVGAHPRKRRRNTISRGTATTTPRSQTADRQGTTSHVWQAGPSASSKRASGAKDNVITPSGRRTRSALDVLADQAAAAFEGGSATHQEVDQSDHCDGTGPSTSDSCANPLAVDSRGPVKMSSIHELVPRVEEAINAAAETSIPGQMEVSMETFCKSGSSGADGRHVTKISFQQPGSQDAMSDKAMAGDRDVTPIEGPAVSIAESKQSSSDSGQNSDWDPFGGIPNFDSGGDSDGDMDAEGDIDPDSQEMSLDGNGIIHSV